MPPAEFPWRAWRALKTRARAQGLGARGQPPPAADAAAPRWLRVPRNLDPVPYLAAAGRIADGRLDVFSLRDLEVGPAPRWNRDPRTGIEAPLDYGPLIDYRDTARVGDIKYLWEPNRHQHLVTLAQAWAVGGGPRYAAALRAHLESWFAACPPGRGPNWSSALEAALRLLSWAAAWQLLGGWRSAVFAGADGRAFRARWLDSVHRHARFVRGHYSRHSSANNHLIGEATGLYVAALTWPHWPAARRWAGEAGALLAAETLRQNAPDGVNREQAVGYQHFVLDLLLVAATAARANGRAVPPPCLARIEAMTEYLACIMDAGGHVPRFGDSDDAVALRLAPQADFCRYRSAIAAGALLCGREDLRRKAGATDDRVRWLFGAAAEPPAAGPPPPPPRRAFPDGGQYVLGCDFETAREIRLVADAGPHGYLSIAAHGHADALSFTLSVGGHELLIDPGTYAYHADPAWRAYFRGTSAHNTVRVDGLDQSEPGGHFLWLRKARSQVHEWRADADAERLVASHDGYARLDDPLVHRRSIRLDPRARGIGIVDELQCAGAHDVELFFHCAGECEVGRLGDDFVLRRGPVAAVLRLPREPGARVQLHRGDTAPILGWESRRFGEKSPAATIAWRARITGARRLLTAIDC